MAEQGTSSSVSPSDQNSSLRSSGGENSSLRSSGSEGGDSGSLRKPQDDSTKESSGGGSSSSKLSDLERSQAIGELRYYAAGHREAIGAMLDGVVLGAQQVQDKRLELLESGPEDSVLDLPVVS